MLDAVTKRRIDSCRDMLVGKVPDPKSQVEQITIALIYKFMDDMDAEAEELGGKRSFFAGEYAQYGWANLMSPKLGGFEMLGLYSEAIAKMPENPGVPPLFRDIFKNAYLPYRDPETLRSFLKEINGFHYDHSERLGDAFEYLLSVLGSQGDAGQFRTPRHIIDFIVKVVDPQKSETILDPACGTAGFLISSYKHILAANAQPGLTADERARLARNLIGYDISPDMVRLSLVNLYLHGFPQPRIEEYDTLTSDDKWNQYADVILANPPFMSPKGGIKPHKRFTVQSSRSEVLFVDYIAEHLTADGRAGVIVPEGIIFQSGGAYKSLREMLVKKHLVAVVSLPAGVFQPYSGVKTSILILDRRLAKASDSILFVKIASDGFGLGAQRRAVPLNDLPEAARLLTAWRESLRDGTPFEASDASNVQVVAKAKIAESGEYNLSGDRYLGVTARASHFPAVALGEVAIIEKGSSITKADTTEGPYAVIAGGQQPAYYHGEYNREGQTITVSASGAYAGFVNYFNKPIFASDCSTIKAKDEAVLDPIYLFRLLKTKQDEIYAMQVGGGQPHVYAKDLRLITLPLPPLPVQQEIVAEIEGYQKIIDGARQVVENYTPRIDIRPEWPMVALGDPAVFQIESGGTPLSSEETYWNGGIPWATLVDLPARDFVSQITRTERTISAEGLKNSSAKLIPVNSVVVSTRATIGRVGINRMPMATNQGFKNIIIQDASKAVPEFVAYMVKGLAPQMEALASGGTFKEISKTAVAPLRIPLPDMEIQRAIVAEIEAEQRLVKASKELVGRFEAKIKAAIGRVWGE